MFGHVLRRGQRAGLVVASRELRGIISITDTKKVPQDGWPTTTVGQIMTPMPLKTFGPDTDLSSALELLVREALNQLPIV